jgi:hypothetical protein
MVFLPTFDPNPGLLKWKARLRASMRHGIDDEFFDHEQNLMLYRLVPPLDLTVGGDGLLHERPMAQ